MSFNENLFSVCVYVWCGTASIRRLSDSILIHTHHFWLLQLQPHLHTYSAWLCTIWVTFLCESHSSEKFYTLILLSTAYLHVKIPPAIIYAGQKNETNHNMLVKSAWAKPYIHQLNHSFVLFKKHLTVQMQTIIVSATFNVPFKSTLSWLFDDGQKVLSIHCSAERVTNCGGRERANWNQA